MIQNSITFFSDINDPFVTYALNLISFFCNVQIKRVPDFSHTIDICYSAAPEIKGNLTIPRIDRYDLNTIPTEIHHHYPKDAHRQEAHFPFDLFTALRFWLADEGNLDHISQGCYDLHGRLLCEFSAQLKKGFSDTPIVNSYLSLFKKWLSHCLKRSFGSYLPADKKCIVVLSHDVDKPINPGDPYDWYFHSKFLLAKGKILPALRKSLSFLKAALKNLDKRNKHWLFEEIMEAEAKLGLSSTFFFAAKSIKEPNSSFYDVDYDISLARYVRMIREILDRGFEVGLHLSYNAHQKTEYIVQEKQRLEEIAGCQIIGNRHHYWKMKHPFWNTLQDHETAGLLYDTSVSFNYSPGYRLGVALPYYPWNPENSRTIRTMQIPTVLMDGAYFYHECIPPQQVVSRFKPILEGLKEYDGTACLDWHSHTSYPGSEAFRAWGEGYLALIRFLSEDPEILLCSAKEANRIAVKSWSLLNSHNS